MINDVMISCSSACVIQCSTLYWMRPIIKNQYIYGGSFINTFKVLWKDHDRLRFYRGFLPSVMKGCTGKTADIALFTYLNKSIERKEYVPLVAACCASSIKMALMPLDTISNIYQVHGIKGKSEIKGNLYRGTMMYGTIHAISSSIWLSCFTNVRSHCHFKNDNLNHMYTGFTCSLLTDIIVNPLRIIKTKKQAFSQNRTYKELYKSIKGSFYNGFGTRLLYNGINSALFVLFWQNLEKKFTLS